MRTVVFINSHSRQAAQHTETIRKFFDKNKRIFDVIDFIVIEELDDFDECLKRLKAHKDMKCVIVGSGDGTIVAVLNALKNRKNLVYGFLPLGTTNAFARSLAMPMALKKSFAVLKDNHVKPVCLGSVNGVLFANAAGVGLDAKTVTDMDTRLKRYLRSAAYNLSAMLLLRNHKPMECELHLGDEVLKFTTHQVVAVNGDHYGPVPISKTASVYDPNLTVIYNTSLGYWGFVRDVYSFVFGRQHKRRNVSVHTADRILVKTRPVRPVQADGEIVGKTPAEIKVIENAIRVIVPAPGQPKRALRRKRKTPR